MYLLKIIQKKIIKKENTILLINSVNRIFGDFNYLLQIKEKLIY